MRPVLEEFARHAAPLGPTGDPDARERSEQAWLASLTDADARALLRWIERPTPLPGWRPLGPDEVEALRSQAAYYLGCAGQAHGNGEIRRGLEALLADPGLRAAAVWGLEALADPAAVPAIAACAGDTDPSVAAQIASTLGALGGEAAVHALQRMRGGWEGRDEHVRKVVDEALREAGERA